MAVAQLADKVEPPYVPMTPIGLHALLQKLAWKLDGKYLHELTQAAEMIASLPTVPKDVFWSPKIERFVVRQPGEHDGYYTLPEIAFYHQWALRRKEFPLVDIGTRTIYLAY